MRDATSLGATLYLPATRTDLAPIASGARYSELRSAVLCLEDAVAADDLPVALANLAALLRTLPPSGGPRLFVRPRDPALLARILQLPNIERIEGFVIPKATADTLPAYLRELQGAAHVLMPTLETREMFDPAEVRRLRDQLLAIQKQILAIRIGGNDLLQQIGARRSAERTIYEGPLAGTVTALVAAFAPFGFALSAPVLEHFTQQDLLRREVERDVEHGLLTKTAIHPEQIAVIQDGYRVSGGELAEARAVLAADSPAVFALGGSMCEPATHRRWAQSVMRRAECFGIRHDPLAAVS
jgi:citrate lyase beta subunit